MHHHEGNAYYQFLSVPKLGDSAYITTGCSENAEMW